MLFQSIDRLVMQMQSQNFGTISVKHTRNKSSITINEDVNRFIFAENQFDELNSGLTQITIGFRSPMIEKGIKNSKVRVPYITQLPTFFSSKSKFCELANISSLDSDVVSSSQIVNLSLLNVFSAQSMIIDEFDDYLETGLRFNAFPLGHHQFSIMYYYFLTEQKKKMHCLFEQIESYEFKSKSFRPWYEYLTRC